jgi:hypothetical protein
MYIKGMCMFQLFIFCKIEIFKNKCRAGRVAQVVGLASERPGVQTPVPSGKKKKKERINIKGKNSHL